jgi:4,5-DOPA dioxygenase extradiol
MTIARISCNNSGVMGNSIFMTRRQVLKVAALVAALKVSALAKGAALVGIQKTGDKKMPVLFVGHGSPMNAIETNEFTEGFHQIAGNMPKPAAIVCVSAHWETRGCAVTAMEAPKTIHDFGGFPRELYKVEYPAAGNPGLASEIIDHLGSAAVAPDREWGLDHGCWVPLMRMYPEADIPVVQLSLDYTRDPRWHFDMGRKLSWLRSKGVLIMGSGNMVHNLNMVAWDKLDKPGFAFDWATEANESMKAHIISGNHAALVDYRSQGRAYQLAIPTPEHFLPLLYALALQEDGDSVSFFNDKPVAGSLTMTSVRIG